MRKYLLIILLVSQASYASDCVVLLHGLGRTSYSMHSLGKSLQEEGYIVVNNGYPSKSASINNLSAAVGDGIAECKKYQAVNIHFVTHSLGGILVRDYFQNNHEPKVKRVVMLAPPNHGSEVTSKNKNKWWYKLFTGEAGQELGVEPESVPNTLKEIPLEVGIITGTKSLDPWFAGVIKGPHDGKVSVESAKLKEMKDFITVPHSHTFIAEASSVHQQVKIFLEQGKFKHVNWRHN